MDINLIHILINDKLYKYSDSRLKRTTRCGVLNGGLHEHSPPLFDLCKCAILGDGALGQQVGGNYLPEIQVFIFFVRGN